MPRPATPRPTRPTGEFGEDEAYAGAFAFAPTGIAVFDLDGSIRHVNPALGELLGLPVEALLAGAVEDFVLPSDREPLRRWLASARLGASESAHGEGWYVRSADGSRFYGSVDATVVTGGLDEPRYGLVMVHDLTEARLMEEALRTTLGELDALVAGMPIAVYKVDADGVVQMWNPAAEQMFGWTAREVVGHPLTDLAFDDPEGAARDLRLLLHPVAATGVEIRRKARDGTLTHLAVWTTPILDDDGELTAVVVAMVDITARTKAEAAVRASSHRFQTLIKNISDTVSVINADGLIEFTTALDQAVLGYETDWWVGRSIFDLAHPDDVEPGLELLRRLRESPGKQLSAHLRARHANGHWEYINVTGRNLLDDPDIKGLVLTTRNITEAKQSEQLLSAQARILELIATSSALDETLGAIIDMVMAHAGGTQASVFLLERGRLVPRGSRQLPHRLLSQVSARDLGTTTLFDLTLDTLQEAVVTDVDTDSLVDWIRPTLQESGIRSCWALPVTAPAEQRPLGIIAIFHDEVGEPDPHERRAAALAAQLTAIAVERHETETQLAHRAVHDDLTGLPNRTLVLDRLTHALARARHLDAEMAVLFLDLDRFKVVNDSLGHRAGDQLLILFADRLRSIVRPEDTVARFGGDEFVILCEQPHGATVTVAIAERLEQAMREPFVLEDGAEVFLSVSLGLAIGVGPDAEVLLRNADAAMYRAKELGRNRLEVFDEAMQAAAVARLNIGNDLRRAIERDEFVVLHQPLVDVRTRQIIGSEALVRWAHPTRGMLPPATFIGVTEESGLIVPLGQWVLDEALSHARVWADQPGSRPFMQSVNLSARQLSSPELVDTVAASLERHRWAPSDLCLELTESVLLDDLDVTLAALVRLKELGVRLAIDDFGTGYSSLTYLQRFPVDSVKIDRSFVTGLSTATPGDARSDATIPRAVVVMAHALGLTALAEGVESEDQLAVLRELGCDHAQGFLFSPPLTFEAFGQLVARQRSTGQ